MGLNKRLIGAGATGSGELVPSENFKAVTYNGNGTTNYIDVGFKPDLVWIKRRNASASHALFDSTRGREYILYPDDTSASAGPIAANRDIKSFDNNGFTLSIDSYGNVNTIGNTYVAWCWKANGGTTSSNTDGTITSTVQANQDAGFSIVTYTGSGSTATIGHGLSAAPEMIIAKSTSDAYEWKIWHKDLSSGYQLLFNTAGQASDSSVWTTTTPTSTVFSIGTNVGVNGGSKNYIAYCFLSVASYSSIGSYTGNGANNVISTGIEPAWLMIKRTNGSGTWMMYDNKRTTSNPRDTILQANLANAELTGSSLGVNFLTNGFEVLGNNGDFNGSGDTYLYLAFAADPSTAPVLADSFNAVTYEGNGFSSYPIPITGFGFSPSMIWFKERTPQGFDHGLYDVVRGTERLIYPDLTQAETDTVDRGVQSFDSDGVTLGDNNKANALNSDYVAWAWKANSAPTINTDGTIQSIVSANQASGFSIVKYTGTGSAATVGHGLSFTPELVILKNLSVSSNWWTWTKDLGGGDKYLALDSTSGVQSATTIWNGTVPTSTVFSVGVDSGANGSGNNIIAYCFASISGFSKIGNYTGDGTTTKTITTGFQPDFVMIKVTSQADNWVILDSVRGGSKNLKPNSSAVEATESGTNVEFISTGFKLIGSGPGLGQTNGSGKSYIYAAFKRNPGILDIPSGKMAFMVIAGGGQGGNGQSGNGGGGGAGGFRTSYGTVSGGGASAESNISLSAGTYTITVGAGGSSATGTNNGSNSSITGNASITSIGGGGGGGRDSTGFHVAASGGSGGGGSANGEASGGVAIRPGGSGTANQGFDGSDSQNYGTYVRAGGGGGSGSLAGTGAIPSNGGYSITSSISGEALAYAGGGGTAGKADNSETYRVPSGFALGGAGTAQGSNTNGSAGVANTGSGGGGAHSTSAQYLGANGGSGIVVLRLLTSEYSSSTTGSPTVTTDGDYTILKYTGSGTYVHS